MLKLNLAGRPKTSGVWDYFKYHLETRCSECIVVGTTAVCGKRIAGRNPTNLKAHLQAFHKETYNELRQKEDALLFSRKPLPTLQGSSGSSGSGSIRAFLSQPKVYPSQSDQHKARVRALAIIIAETSIPTTFSATDAFRSFCKVMDPKFAVPFKTNNLKYDCEFVFQSALSRVVS